MSRKNTRRASARGGYAQYEGERGGESRFRDEDRFFRHEVRTRGNDDYRRFPAQERYRDDNAYRGARGREEYGHYRQNAPHRDEERRFAGNERSGEESSGQRYSRDYDDYYSPGRGGTYGDDNYRRRESRNDRSPYVRGSPAYDDDEGSSPYPQRWIGESQDYPETPRRDRDDYR